MAEVIKVHPNSMAARKWKRSEWRSSRNLWADAADCERAGMREKAAALRRAAGRAQAKSMHCG